ASLRQRGTGKDAASAPQHSSLNARHRGELRRHFEPFFGLFSMDARCHPRMTRTLPPNYSSVTNGVADLPGLGQLPQYVGKDAAVLVIIYFNGRIDSALRGDLFRPAIRAGDANGDILLRLEVFAQAENVIGFGSVQFKC